MLQLLLLTFCFFKAHAFHVVIDPGHGGKDHGAVKSESYESHIVLQVSKHLEALLKKDSDFKVSMTRQDDEFVSLKGRAEIAAQVDGDLFVSIHVNSSPDRKAQGAEFYFQNQLPPDEESIFLAARENNMDEEDGGRPKLPHKSKFIHTSNLKPEVQTILLDLIRNHKIMDSSVLTKTLKENWKGSQRSAKNSIRQAPFYVVSQLEIPSVLIELGFLTNPEEGKKLSEPSYQKLVAQSIYDGLVAYKKQTTGL
jgi:N-acetylmuramoyl-L-alanine amidase